MIWRLGSSDNRLSDQYALFRPRISLVEIQPSALPCDNPAQLLWAEVTQTLDFHAENQMNSFNPKKGHICNLIILTSTPRILHKIEIVILLKHRRDDFLLISEGMFQPPNLSCPFIQNIENFYWSDPSCNIPGLARLNVIF